MRHSIRHFYRMCGVKVVLKIAFDYVYNTEQYMFSFGS